MPVKFSKSFKEYNKTSKTTTMKHDYIKHKSTEDLIKYLNEGSNKRVKRKVRIELDRRKVKLVWVTPESELTE